MSIVSCPNCGHPNVDSAKFCAKCGNKLNPSADTVVMSGLGDSGVTYPPAPPTPAREATPPMSAKEQAAYTPPAYTPPTPVYTPPRPAGAPLPGAPVPAYTPGAGAYGGGQPAAPAVEPTAGGHRFVAMRTIAGLANILAWVSLVLGFLGGLVWGWALGSGLLGNGIGGVIGGLIAGAVAGGLGWVYWRLLGEGIWVILDIADNTRRTAAALERQQRS